MYKRQPLHTGKGRTVGTAIADILDYVKNPQKTDNGRLITGWQCDSRVADAEFLLSKRQYATLTGRTRGEDDVIAYHVRQSFVPGEITPEEANRIGVDVYKRQGVYLDGNSRYKNGIRTGLPIRSWRNRSAPFTTFPRTLFHQGQAEPLPWLTEQKGMPTMWLPVCVLRTTKTAAGGK